MATIVPVIVTAVPGLGRLEQIPDGEAGTRATMAKMRTLARAGAADSRVRDMAQRIVTEAGARPGTLQAVSALFAWVRDHIAYKSDPRVTLRGRRLSFDQVSEPARTLEKLAEDCDGKATLLAAMLLAVGTPGRVLLRAISTHPLSPRHFVHVYAVLELGGRFLPLDCTYRGTALGWEFPRAVARLDLAV